MVATPSVATDSLRPWCSNRELCGAACVIECEQIDTDMEECQHSYSWRLMQSINENVVTGDITQLRVGAGKRRHD